MCGPLLSHLNPSVRPDPCHVPPLTAGGNARVNELRPGENKNIGTFCSKTCGVDEIGGETYSLKKIL